jgi:hypothetical protein
MPKFRTLVRSPIVAAAIVLATAGQAAATAYGDYTGTGIRIRTCPHSTCGVLGLGYPGQGVAVTCGVDGDNVNGNYLWFLHTNRTTLKRGYSSAEYIGISSGTWYFPC